MKGPQVCGKAEAVGYRFCKAKVSDQYWQKLSFLYKNHTVFQSHSDPQLEFLYTYRCKQQHTRFAPPCRHPKTVTVPDTFLGLGQSCPTLDPHFDPIPACQPGAAAPLGWHSHQTPVWEQWWQRWRGEGTVLGALAAVRLQVCLERLLRTGIFHFFII